MIYDEWMRQFKDHLKYKSENECVHRYGFVDEAFD